MIAVFGGKWRPLIMLQLIGGPRQFLELQRIIPGISQKVLTQHLRALVAEGIVFRNSAGKAPAPVSYGLTTYGETVIPILDAMCQWGHDHHRLHPGKRRHVTAQVKPVAPFTRSGLAIPKRSITKRRGQSRAVPVLSRPSSSPLVPAFP